jgi:hypothetical protein
MNIKKDVLRFFVALIIMSISIEVIYGINKTAGWTLAILIITGVSVKNPYALLLAGQSSNSLRNAEPN